MSNPTEIFGEKILTAEKVSKIYGKGNNPLKGVEALKNLSIEIPQGSIYGLLGPNGAGKSTLLRLWVGLLRPTQGTVHVWGQEPRLLPVEQRQRIGYASETMTLPDWMKVHELIGFNKSFYPAWDDAFCQEMIHHFKLPLDRNVKALSRGEQRKLALLLYEFLWSRPINRKNIYWKRLGFCVPFVLPPIIAIFIQGMIRLMFYQSVAWWICSLPIILALINFLMPSQYRILMTFYLSAFLFSGLHKVMGSEQNAFLLTIVLLLSYSLFFRLWHYRNLMKRDWVGKSESWMSV